MTFKPQTYRVSNAKKVIQESEPMDGCVFCGGGVDEGETSDPCINGGAKDGFDMNLEPAWRKGYTGKRVVVSILDDGIQTNHPDLAQNYDHGASTDINDNDDDPMPRDNGDNKHGTRCAGEVAAVAFNSYCGVGVAYNASIGVAVWGASRGASGAGSGGTDPIED
ncbi:hypothetical protein QAD02_003543 [Eretmocerus hayati]|uniref:Uncharacterized protein n=1 Tax=Eretmocerus hayati TaxID=131215 RepID=A0ACC2NMI5_9HYME|nr:hypothetical protein QAD02_003543 [Eretmocerus hayati]